MVTNNVIKVPFIHDEAGARGLSMAGNKTGSILDIILLLNERDGFVRYAEDVLRIIGESLSASHTFIVKLDDGLMKVEYAWESPDAPYDDPPYSHVPSSRYAARWMNIFSKHESVVVEDIESIREAYPDEYKLMSAGGVRSYTLEPLYLDGSFYGWIGVEDAKNKDYADYIHTAAKAIMSAISRDIASKRLEKSHAIYEEAFRMNETAIWEYDVQNGHISLTRDAYTLELAERYGQPMEDVDGTRSIPSWVSPVSRGRFEDLFRRIKNGADVSSADIKTVTPDRKEELFRFVVRVAERKEGKPVKAIGTSRNITSQWDEHMQYQSEMSYYHDVQDPELLSKAHHDLSAKKVIEFMNMDGHIMRNLDLLAFEMGLKQSMNFAATPEDQAWLDELCMDTFIKKYHSGVQRIYRVMRCRDDVDIAAWIDLDIRLLASPKTGHIECFVYMYDVTRKHIEEIMLKKITELGYDFIGYVNSRKGTVSFYVYDVNMTRGGRTDGKCAYDELRDIFYTRGVAEKERAYLDKATELDTVLSELEKKGRYTVSFKRMVKGKECQKQVQYYYLNRCEKTMFFAIRDMTEEFRKAQQQIHSLEEANRAKLEFVSHMNHDIRTPIGIVRNMLDFARKDVDDKERLQKDLDGIQAGADFLMSLINDILDVSMADRGKLELKLQKFDYEHHIEYIRSVLEPLCEEKGVKWQIIRHEPRGTAVLDTTRMNQIQLNLIGNAVKYTPRGGEVTCELDAEDVTDDSMTVVLRVKDTGIGMSESFQRHMFDSFAEEMDNPLRTQDMAGTGLGLTIVRRLIDIMGASIDVKSAIGKGTEFTVKIPCSRLPIAEKMEEKDEGNNGEVILSGKVLVADDNDINCMIIERMLRACGLDVMIAKDGIEALDMFMTSEPNEFIAVIVDIMMPKLDGYGVTEKIRHSGREDASLPIIALSANAYGEAREKGLKAGMDEYLTKPINARELNDCLQKLIVH